MAQATDIERIVQEVLRQLKPAMSAADIGTKKEPQELTINDRVVSTVQIESRLKGIRSVRVGPRAIVTPAARDLLRERNVQLTRCDRAVKHAAPQSLVVGVAESKFDPAGLLGAKFEQIARTGLENVLAEMADQVAGGGKRGILFTSRRHAALHLANSRPGVRAAAAKNLADYKDAADQIEVNLLVLDPAGASQFELRRIVEEFQR